MKKHSSRRQRLDHTVLNQLLHGAQSYDRIAGFFRSSLFEVAGEAIMGVADKVRVVCNSACHPNDLKTAQAAQAALRKDWCSGKPELAPSQAMPRYQALYDALTSRKLEVKVLPDEIFGLVHGKAGVIRYADGSATAFLGSVNESATAWKLNYELLWEDDAVDTVKWVQEEFDALWNHSSAVDLSCCPFIERDIARTLKRTVVGPNDWRKQTDPTAAAASATVETPLYRKEQGLWPHQKYFSKLALERHRLGGARLLLADQVGLGKTIQLAMAAMLMALDDPDGGPILILAPKPLLKQWQAELMELLLLPSAWWNGKAWVDENRVEHESGEKSLIRCPRRIGMISQGLVVRGNKKIINQILNINYTCVIVDEAHRARRRNLPGIDAGTVEINEPAEPNKLMEFLREIGSKTKSMLLATATPVQLHPVEAWDLLNLLSRGNEGVLGGWTRTSPWYQASTCLKIVTGEEAVPFGDDRLGWEYVRDPLPARSESPAFARIRDRLNAPDFKWQFKPEEIDELPLAIRNVQLKSDLLPDYGSRHNPFLRCIVRRTRGYLENTINPITGSYYLPKVTVRLFGEDADDSVMLGGYLQGAYEEAENFSDLLKKRVRGAGFFKTLLLRRLGSSMEAGRKTVKKLLGAEFEAAGLEEDDWTDDEETDELPESNQSSAGGSSDFKDFTKAEIKSLSRCLHLLEEGGNRDPKLEAIIDYLLGGKSSANQSWLELGCILFSQYYDTARWIGEEISRRSEFVGLDIGLYAGSSKSGFWKAGKFQRCDRDLLKQRVKNGELRLLLGTDAASEGLNLQRLGTLINIDLPWNPTRLEQRKGRIQRIGQLREEVWIANLRYRGSVEDRVHQVLADRLEAIHGLFGQIPDTLEKAWVHIALKNEEAARQLIDKTAGGQNPFDEKYSKVVDENWETCEMVIDPFEVREMLEKGW